VTITPADVPRTAAQIRTAGELWEMHGDLMLATLEDWKAGAKAANLDPNSRGNRYEECDVPCEHCPHPVPSDPTGEGMLRARAELGDELQKRMTRMVDDALWLRDTAHVLAPIVPPSTMNDPSDLWCSHHLRLGLCEPRHRNDLCRYCGDFLALWKVRPPIGILRDRHQGKRITEARVKEALAADGVILQTVGGVTKAIRQARGTGKRNQNQKRKAG
jgi:hypothetical protein